MSDTAPHTNAPTALRRHLSRSPSLFDPHEAIELLESLVRLTRTQAHKKGEEYSAALDKVKARRALFESGHLQGLMLGLVGDPQTGQRGDFHFQGGLQVATIWLSR